MVICLDKENVYFLSSVPARTIMNSVQNGNTCIAGIPSMASATRRGHLNPNVISNKTPVTISINLCTGGVKTNNDQAMSETAAMINAQHHLGERSVCLKLEMNF